MNSHARPRAMSAANVPVPVPEALSATQVATFKNADPNAVIAVLSAMRPQLRKNIWLANRNPFRYDVVEKIKAIKARRAENPTQVLRYGTLVKYIAASAILHAADAARYLSRALLCTSLNDVHAARHLAYYAELRATMSLLACSGVGVFDKTHVIVASRADIKLISGPPTHQFVWGAFRQWATSLHAEETIATVLRAAGWSLRDIVSAANSGITIRPAIIEWLHDWGLDLASVAQDQYRRNESTYRASDMEPIASCPLPNVLEFMKEFWKLFDPSQASRFEVIDEQLVRFALEAVLTRREKGKGKGVDVQTFTSLMSSLGSSASTHRRLESVLTRVGELASDSVVFSYARATPRHGDPTLHLSMISRAALLSRLAIGSVTNLLSSAAVPISEVEFWLEEYGSGAGLWDSKPDDFQDLWLDVDSALEAIQIADPSLSQQIWSSSFAREIVVLGEFERVAAWGIAS